MGAWTRGGRRALGACAARWMSLLPTFSRPPFLFLRSTCSGTCESHALCKDCGLRGGEGLPESLENDSALPQRVPQACRRARCTQLRDRDDLSHVLTPPQPAAAATEAAFVVSLFYGPQWCIIPPTLSILIIAQSHLALSMPLRGARSGALAR